MPEARFPWHRQAPDHMCDEDIREPDGTIRPDQLDPDCPGCVWEAWQLERAKLRPLVYAAILEVFPGDLRAELREQLEGLLGELGPEIAGLLAREALIWG